MADRLVDVYMLLRETYETLRYATVYMQVHCTTCTVYYHVVVKKISGHYLF